MASIGSARAVMGNLIFLGNGQTAKVHHPAYDFNDQALPYGIGYWVNLVEMTLAA